MAAENYVKEFRGVMINDNNIKMKIFVYKKIV